MDRRKFLKLAGIGSLSVAAGCTYDAEKRLYSLVEAPDDMVTGKATWYASTCRECPAGCGLIARNREARVVKVEGNPLHPVNRGKLCMRGQAALQGLYNPDRLQTPLLKEDGEWRPVSYDEAASLLKRKAAGAGRMRCLSELTGETTGAILSEFLKTHASPPPVFFESFAHESLKTANERVFGIDGLSSYRLDQADVIIGLGADFLETWLSPVEYAAQFKSAHGYHHGEKSVFIHISPFQSMTGVNADLWVSVTPGAEAVVALGLVREALKAGKGTGLPGNIREALTEFSATFTPERVVRRSGVDLNLYRKTAAFMLGSKRPLVLGQGMAGDGPDGLRANIAANLLNLVLDPELTRIDFHHRHRVEQAARRASVTAFFDELAEDGDVDLLLLNNVNPVFAMPNAASVVDALERDDLFVVSFSNFMDQTSRRADLILPTALPLERWGEYAGKTGMVSLMQPTMGSFTGAPALGDLLLRLMTPDGPAPTVQDRLSAALTQKGLVNNRREWFQAVQHGGIFDTGETNETFQWKFSSDALKPLEPLKLPAPADQLTLLAAPSIRFFDGRGANKPWLAEFPDPLTQVAWQSTVMMSPRTLFENGFRQGDMVELETDWGHLKAPVYEYPGLAPHAMVMTVGQGHDGFGRYANGQGLNPISLMSPDPSADTGGPQMAAAIAIEKTGGQKVLANVDGSRTQHGRKIAMSVALADLSHGGHGHDVHQGFGMHEFPMTLPLPDGYDPHRDVYPPHEHQDDYRWGMIVDLDRCIGCGACAVACYAENNIGVVGEKRVIEGREMAWIRIERYHDPHTPEKLIFLPMMCQHCDNAPCESVCPVYAPHHGKEGMNNQIYNRCIGTRYCSQNCPYKVRRFNWFEWERPKPSHLQLNPDVTVRMKGVMEKCSFCVQRVKLAHDEAKNEKRRIRDGEVQPACVQTCPTGALVFGNMADKESRVRKMTDDPRAYQVMGYLNTKTAVIYLKKVVREI